METIKWFGTILCLLGIAFTSFNIYPLNLLFGLIGSGLWTYAGFLQKDNPLMLVEFVAVVLYVMGLITFIYNQLSLWGIL
jgi:ABC-type microcin C transport system permease subunit YejB